MDPAMTCAIWTRWRIRYATWTIFCLVSASKEESRSTLCWDWQQDHISDPSGFTLCSFFVHCKCGSEESRTSARVLCGDSRQTMARTRGFEIYHLSKVGHKMRVALDISKCPNVNALLNISKIPKETWRHKLYLYGNLFILHELVYPGKS